MKSKDLTVAAHRSKAGPADSSVLRTRNKNQTEGRMRALDSKLKLCRVLDWSVLL